MKRHAILLLVPLLLSGCMMEKPTVKNYRRVSAMPELTPVTVEQLRQLVAADTTHYKVVVLIQNGLGLEKDFSLRFPGVSVVAGLAFICSSKTEPGIVNHQCFGQIRLGNYNCVDRQRIEEFADALQLAGVKTTWRNSTRHGGRRPYGTFRSTGCRSCTTSLPTSSLQTPTQQG